MLTETTLDTNITTIYKFQKAEQIVKQLFEAFDKSSGSIGKMIKNQKDCKLICVFSPAGAAGKSTIAYNLSHQYAMQSHKVLLLSFEAFSSLSILGRGEHSKGLIFLLYLIKNKLPNLQLKLNSIKTIDSTTNIHFVERENSILEFKDIKMEDMALLAEFLKKQSGYDVVILDLDSTINEITLGAFKHCDLIANIFCNDGFNNAKQEDFKKQIPKINELLEIDISSKLINVLNKYNSIGDKEGVESSQCCGQIEIPYINNSDINNGAYYPEMTYFKQLYDMLENIFSKKVIIDDHCKQ